MKNGSNHETLICSYYRALLCYPFTFKLIKAVKLPSETKSPKNA